MRGGIAEVVEFSERLKDTMERAGLSSGSVEDFDDWRPKKGDCEKDLERKTAKHASIRDTEVEANSEGFIGDMRRAKEDVKRAAIEMNGGETPGEHLKNGLGEFSRPFVASILKIVRRTEETVYSDFMLKFNSYYFHTDRLSICLKKRGQEFVMHVNSPVEEYREILQDELTSI